MKAPKILIKVLLAILIFVAIFLSYFTIREYRPKKLEEMTITSNSNKKVKLDDNISLMTFNIGYSGLGKDEDFVMDGGKKGRADSKDVVLKYLEGIKNILTENEVDFYLLQEVDNPSRRSYFTNQTKEFKELFNDYDESFSLNFKADFVPFPVSFTDYIGKVESGIQTLSRFEISSSVRHQTPGSFSWPLRIANLKRAIQVNHLDIEGSDKKLVIINLHLSAYDDGGMRVLETEYLMEILKEERSLGNYVIVGGDFNQTYEAVESNFKIPEEAINKGIWAPLTLKEENITFGYNFIYSEEATCRSLDKPLTDVNNHYYYIIDGFLISDNIELVNFENLNIGFLYSDHEPLKMEVKLLP